jgi:ABC-type antimicrobial peptide transport system permease subunit
MFKSYFKIAWRNIIRNKVYSVINILGLAFGICSCIVIYLITSYEFSFDKFHQDGNRIYRAVLNIDNPANGKDYRSQIPYAAAMTIQQQFTGIEKTANFFSYSAQVTVPEAGKPSKRFFQTYPSQTIISQSSYFTVFSYQWLYGNPSTALEQPFKIVLTESRARMYFGSLPLDKVIGKELIYDDSLHLTVSGIVKDWSQHSDLIFKEFISYSTIQSSFLKHVSDLQQASNPDWTLPDYTQNFVKLANGTTTAQFEQQAAILVKDHMLQKNDPTSVTMKLQPLSDIHFNNNYCDFYSRQANLPALYMLMGIAAFILIIAAVNFINLSTAQSLSRAKEIGIRKLLGSDRRSLVLQFLTETFILTCLAVVCSLLFVKPVLDSFKNFIPGGVTLNLADSFTWIFLMGTIIFTSLLAGLYPAFVLSSYSPVKSLQARVVARRKGYLQKSLIVFQFTISLLFIIGTIVIGSQTHFLLNKDMGFKKDAIISINTSDNYATNKRNVLAESIRKLPGVSMVSACWTPPMIDFNKSEQNFLQLTGSTNTVDCSERIGDEYYVPLFGLKIMAGRNIMPPHDDAVGFVPARVPYGFTFPKKQTEILITETCAKQLGFKTPQEAIGHSVRTPAPNLDALSGPIVGVVADFHAQSLFSPMRPAYIYGSRNLWRGGVQVKLVLPNNNSAQLQTLLKAIEKCWKQIYPEEEFKYQFLDNTIANMYTEQRRTTQVTTAAMIVAIFISCMGLFALFSLTAEERTKEIGIRKVLGASVGGIIATLSKDFIQLIFLSILIASPVAWYFLHRWLQGFAYHIKINWWIFVLSGAGAVIIALITVSFQAIKAAVANPVESLRTE